MLKKQEKTKPKKTAGTPDKTTTRKTASTQKTTTKKTTAGKASTRKTAAAKAATKTIVYRGVSLGAAVPPFSVPSTGGREFTPRDLKNRITILYFYPKDNTPGCTLEGHDFKARHGEIQKLGAQVVGVSRDSLKSHGNFKAKCGFPFELLSDAEDALGKIFDVIQMKKLYGRTFEGIERSTFVIDADGKLRKEWRRVRVDGHAAEVVAYIRDGMKEE